MRPDAASLGTATLLAASPSQPHAACLVCRPAILPQPAIQPRSVRLYPPVVPVVAAQEAARTSVQPSLSPVSHPVSLDNSSYLSLDLGLDLNFYLDLWLSSSVVGWCCLAGEAAVMIGHCSGGRSEAVWQSIQCWHGSPA